MFTALPGAARIEVDDIEIEDNEENLKVSPYLYHDGMYFKCKGRKDVPFVLLNSILKENLPSLYFDLLCILSDYTYLNSFLLRKRLAYLKNHEKMSTTGMRRTLNAMRQKGLILEYELFHKGEDQSIKGSPFIYAVSPLGYKYLKKVVLTNLLKMKNKAFLLNANGCCAFCRKTNFLYFLKNSTSLVGVLHTVISLILSIKIQE